MIEPIEAISPWSTDKAIPDLVVKINELVTAQNEMQGRFDLFVNFVKAASGTGDRIMEAMVQNPVVYSIFATIILWVVFSRKDY